MLRRRQHHPISNITSVYRKISLLLKSYTDLPVLDSIPAFSVCGYFDHPYWTKDVFTWGFQHWNWNWNCYFCRREWDLGNYWPAKLECAQIKAGFGETSAGEIRFSIPPPPSFTSGPSFYNRDETFRNMIDTLDSYILHAIHFYCSISIVQWQHIRHL